MRWRFLFFCCSFSTPTRFHTLWQIIGNELERNPLKYIGCLFYKPYTFLDCRFIFMMKFTLLFSSFGTMSCVVKQEAVFPLSFEAISPFCLVQAFAYTHNPAPWLFFLRPERMLNWRLYHIPLKIRSLHSQESRNPCLLWFFLVKCN